MRLSRSHIILNFLLFQCGWFACVLGGANQLGWLGSLIALGVMVLHVRFASQPQLALTLLVIALGIGLLFESLLTLTGISHYHDGIVVANFPPHWMLLMWPLFATTLNVSMRWITELPAYAISLLAALLAPASYAAGAQLGAITFPDITLALLAIAAGWAIVFPVLTAAAQRFNGYPAPTPPAPTLSAEESDYV